MTTSISTIGIMFDGPGDEFPRLSDMGYGWTGEFHYPDELAAWFVVAQDPGRVTYFDEDSEATDTTNWDAIVGGLGDLPNVQICGQHHDGRYVHDYTDVDVADALDRGYAIVGKVLCIDPGSEDLDEMVRYRTALSDYPFLDEDAYYVLESAAWDRYMDDGLRYDTLRDMEDSLDESTIESIENSWTDVAGWACQHLHYYNGFSGEFGPSFDWCIAAEISRRLCMMLLGMPADQPFFGHGVA